MDWKKEQAKQEKNRLTKIKKLRQHLTNEQMDALLSVATVINDFATDYIENDFVILKIISKIELPAIAIVKLTTNEIKKV